MDVLFESNQKSLAFRALFVSRFSYGQFLCRVLPPDLERGFEFDGRLGRTCELRTRNLENEILVFAGACGIGSLGFAFFNGRWPSSLNGWMIGQILKPEGPQLFANLTLRRVAVLVQRFKILK